MTRISRDFGDADDADRHIVGRARASGDGPHAGTPQPRCDPSPSGRSPRCLRRGIVHRLFKQRRDVPQSSQFPSFDGGAATIRRSISPHASVTIGRMAQGGDRYIAYTHRYFRFWLPVYDWFALSIGYVYRASTERARIAAGERIVDICTGTGEMAIRLAEAGARVTGIDVTPEMLASATAKQATHGIGFGLMDARHLGFADRSFDTAVLSLALHDMPRAVAIEVLREAARVARNRILILDYELPRRPLLHRLSVAAIAWFETIYFRRYVREGLDPLLADAGLHRSTRNRVGVSFFALCEVTL